MKTKFSKTFTTYFFPVGGDARQIVEEWVSYLMEEKLWGGEDPLFPTTRVVLGADCQFASDGLERAHWSNATPIRVIFRDAFERAGLPYCNPHSFRKILARRGEEVCNSPEEFKAWSQNLGHEQALTTSMSCGAVATDRQGAIIKGVNAVKSSLQHLGADAIVEALFQRLQQEGATFQAVRPSS